MLNKIILFVYAFLIFTSCSTNITPKEARDNASETIEDVVHQKGAKVISTVDYESAIDNIVSFEQRGFIGKYWWVVVFVGVWIIIISVLDEFTDTSISRDMMKRPMTKTKAYTVLLCLGIFGGHYIYLDKHKWLAWITIVILLIIPLWNYKPIMYFHDIPSLLFVQNIGCYSLPKLGLFYITESVLLGLFALNLVIGLICVPYWVYQFNGNYFRKHSDNDDILKGKKLEVDKFYTQQLLPNVKKTNKDADEVNDRLKNEDFILYDESDEKISGFLKSIFTLGNSSTLKYKVGRLRLLRNCCQVLSEDIDQFETDNDRLFYFLQYYRIAAYRNLYLAKELISIIKDKVSSKQQELIKDEFPEIIPLKNYNPDNVYFNSSTVAFDSDNFFDSVGSSLSNSFDSLSSKLDKEGNLSKNDFIGAAIEVGIDSLVAAIDGLFSMYSRTNEALREVEYNIGKANSYLSKALPAINRYQAELARQSEIMVALSNCNKAFVMAYDPLRKIVFGAPTFKSFIFGIKKDQGKLNSEKFRKQLLHLIQVCTEYNKVYNARTGNDVDRINKPQYSQEQSEKTNKIHEQVKEINKDKKNSETNTIKDSYVAKKRESPRKQPLHDITREQVLDVIKDNIRKYNISEETSIKNLKLDKNKYTKSALCIRLNDTFKTRIKPEHFQKFSSVKDIIDFVYYN